MINKDPETNNIWMDMFYKKTDTLRCAPFNSCHPKQHKKNMPFIFAKRIFIIVETSAKPLLSVFLLECNKL